MASKLAGADRSRVRIESPDWYYRCLRASVRFDVWKNDVLSPARRSERDRRMVQGTGLLPYLALSMRRAADY